LDRQVPEVLEVLKGQRDPWDQQDFKDQGVLLVSRETLDPQAPKVLKEYKGQEVS
jgi:hypothetical protein